MHPKIVKLHEFADTQQEELIHAAVASLKLGHVIALPTDTIYGIAALTQSCNAVQKLYEIKGRHQEKPVAIAVGNIEDVKRWGKVTVSDDILTDLLPGPVTLVFERTPELNPSLNPGTTLIGIRIPNHHFVRKLAKACAEPIALTSANQSSAMSSLKVEEFKSLWPHLDLVVDGGPVGDSPECRQGSTVINLSVPGQFSIIREGSAYQQTLDVLEAKYGLTNTER
ncbi:predicted protein [Nematostella vectensis]|uniref:Threonylcarbamoyl-AMP synthase n=1 Tax=Nematostella vectensis TaxID=45351 RepID=A7RPA3_NEMVE|nr:predicted protein [Nematostella vectensis]|eukprot:XP_001638711.1 predicted protein [Nematostella vectensis]